VIYSQVTEGGDNDIRERLRAVAVSGQDTPMTGSLTANTPQKMLFRGPALHNLGISD